MRAIIWTRGSSNWSTRQEPQDGGWSSLWTAILGHDSFSLRQQSIGAGYTDTSIILNMSTEFEEKITKQTSVYRTLGQGLKTLHDHQYADVE